MRTERELRRYTRRELRSLGVEAPLDVDTLCERLAARQQRPITLVPHAMPVPGPSGIWFAAAEADYIVYQSETTTSHQDHIIYHELAHIMAGHGDAWNEEPDVGPWHHLMPNLSRETINRVLLRTCFDDEREREVETIATILREWASVLHHVYPRRPSHPTATRLGRAFGERQDWL